MRFGGRQKSDSSASLENRTQNFKKKAARYGYDVSNIISKHVLRADTQDARGPDHSKRIESPHHIMFKSKNITKVYA